MARGLHALLPPIEVAVESMCNADPDQPRQWEAGLTEQLQGREPSRRVRSAPFVQIPLGVTEDRLMGTVDLEASMRVSCRSRFALGMVSGRPQRFVRILDLD